MTDQPSENGFSALGVDASIAAVLATLGITTPTPIQHAAIPVALKGQDVLGIAQTGTGKTFAFGLPMLQRLKEGDGRALILLPTRELAEQVEQSLRPVAQSFGVQTAVFIGGASMEQQRRMLKQNPRILIATPGRLIDHLERKTVTLKEVSVLVLDEADRMLDMGFLPQLKRIMAHVPAERQTLLFSATMPGEILQMVTTYMKLPVHIEIAPAGTTAERVEQAILIIKRDDKPEALLQLLNDYSRTVLVFVRTKYGARKLTRQLNTKNIGAAEIHSDRSLHQRREALAGFKSGKYRVLIATDIAARGIDVSDIELVVNYDLPQNLDEYVHRIGRTGRAGKQGQAVSFATPDQRDDVRRIEKLIRTELTVAEHPAVQGEGIRPPRVRSFRPRRRR